MRLLLLALGLALIPVSAGAQWATPPPPQYELVLLDGVGNRTPVAGPFDSMQACMSYELMLGGPPQGEHYYCWMLSP